MIATTIEQSRHLLELGLDPNTADCMWLVTSRARLHVLDGEPISNYDRWENYPAWSLSALLEVMPRPDLYREIADLWVCATFFKEGSIRGFGKTAIDAVCDTIEKMFGRGYLIKKGGQDGK